MNRFYLIEENISQEACGKNSIVNHSHKKWKNSLEGSLDRALFAAEFEFPKILVPRLPQNSSNVNIECAGKSKYYATSFLEH